eukprot:GDKI01032083.1.p1 GENE.GDKI01032083.1~~GDKI01032083.1.p1  ORF type:complete len:193 (-),score=69.81 GDKI01032083.1:38-616(-)
MSLPELTEKGTSTRQIPLAKFIDNVESFIGSSNPDQVQEKMQELHSKYNFMFSNLRRQREATFVKLPDLKSALQSVQQLRAKQEAANGEDVQLYYQLSDNLYAKAAVPKTDMVTLWLGANCCLEYTLDEAETLLNKNYKAAKDLIDSLESDLNLIREQMTTTEVNIARVHNWAVMKRNAEKAEAAKSASSKE